MNLTVVLDTNVIEMWGYSKSTHFEGSSDEADWRFVGKSAEYDSDDKIVDICSGTHFTLFVTQSGQLFGTGPLFF
jgi:alpha-tubulin suppressor-like RCC1 family protein